MCQVHEGAMCNYRWQVCINGIKRYLRRKKNCDQICSPLHVQGKLNSRAKMENCRNNEGFLTGRQRPSSRIWDQSNGHCQLHTKLSTQQEPDR